MCLVRAPHSSHLLGLEAVWEGMRRSGGREIGYGVSVVAPASLGRPCSCADTGRIKAFEVLSASAAYWLGQQTNDSLQRIYGCSFPDKKLMKEHLTRLEEAKKVRRCRALLVSLWRGSSLLPLFCPLGLSTWSVANLSVSLCGCCGRC
jgi:hypothetical protein